MCNQTQSVTLQTAVLLTVKEFAQANQPFSVHDITRTIRSKAANGDLEIPEVEVAGASFRFDIPHAKVKGLLYDLGSFPVAVPDKKEHYIIGELYQLKRPEEFDWAFAQLDDYEGVIVEPGEEQLYRRDIAEVFSDNGSMKAWVYWYNAPVKKAPVIASGDLLQYIKGKK